MSEKIHQYDHSEYCFGYINPGAILHTGFLEFLLGFFLVYLLCWDLIRYFFAKTTNLDYRESRASSHLFSNEDGEEGGEENDEGNEGEEGVEAEGIED